MVKEFNAQINIAKALGIIAIICCHINCDYFFGSFNCVRNWNVPLFFIISGYFFNPKINTLSNLFLQFKKITLKYLSRFYAYHLFFGLITMLIYIFFHRTYHVLPNFQTLFITPIYSEPFMFNAPCWFLYQLSISLIIFNIIIFFFNKFFKNIYFLSIIFVPLAILGILCTKPNFEPTIDAYCLIPRTTLSLFYIYAGYLFKNKLENKTTYSIKTFLIVLILQCLVQSYMKTDIGLVAVTVHHNISPLITPLTGSYLILFLAKMLEPYVSKGSFIDNIGKQTLHIMALHLFIIFLIQSAIFLIDGIPFSELPDITLIGNFYKMEKYQYIYIFGSLIISTYIGMGFNKFDKKIHEYLKAKQRI